MTKRTRLVLAAVAALAALPGLAAAQRAEQQPKKNIVQVATEAGSFTTLVTALKAADLVKTLEGAGPFTVFAPTDAAFAKLPPGTLDALLQDRGKLASILTYHVVAGQVMAKDIVKGGGMTPKTVNGQPLDITVRGGGVYVNGARVVTADIVASNGVIHVIDTVLLPPTATTSSR